MQDVTDKKCTILHALDIIGRKWKLTILWYLHEKENTRYNELKRRITGITNMMITKFLMELKDDGLVKRTQYDTVPLKVKYSLTDKGLALLLTLNDLYKWDQAHMEKR